MKEDNISVALSAERIIVTTRLPTISAFKHSRDHHKAVDGSHVIGTNIKQDTGDALPSTTSFTGEMTTPNTIMLTPVKLGKIPMLNTMETRIVSAEYGLEVSNGYLTSVDKTNG